MNIKASHITKYGLTLYLGSEGLSEKLLWGAMWKGAPLYS